MVRAKRTGAVAASTPSIGRPTTPNAPAPAVLLPEKSAAHVAKNAENTVEFLHRTMEAEGFWTPNADLAVYLRQPLLSLHSMGRDEINVIWTTMLVLIHCMTNLVDYHQYWMKLADTARAWLFRQPFFEVAYVDLIKRGCVLMGGVDPKAMLASVFSKDGSTTDVDALLEPRRCGNWVDMYLDTPPYSKYYWNQVTNETRWDHPSEYSTTQPSAAEREAQVRAQVLATAKAERVAKVLPMRITINRKPYMPPKPEVVLDVALKSLHVGDVVIDAQACESCVAKEAKTASVFCQACDFSTPAAPATSTATTTTPSFSFGNTTTTPASSGFGFASTTSTPAAPSAFSFGGSSGFGNTANKPATAFGFPSATTSTTSTTTSANAASSSMQAAAFANSPLDSLQGVRMAYTDPFQSRFKYMFYNAVDPAQKHLYTRPPHVGEKLWIQAQRDNPDPANLVPAAVVGFKELSTRIQLQQAHIKKFHGYAKVPVLLFAAHVVILLHDGGIKME
ncbi:hypothetical protein B5M09_000234 [Aphanomyces astaci]|uniref:WW domain-containing protein n=1 Tax=Aphanomyces astaci TaxID=112090 RepID=A0A425D756_APHAT|nr:hypothetical protein B5M09_000234 [Aphanomyces astaci]